MKCAQFRVSGAAAKLLGRPARNVAYEMLPKGVCAMLYRGEVNSTTRSRRVGGDEMERIIFDSSF